MQGAGQPNKSITQREEQIIMSTNPVGKTRNAGVVILLGIITFGIYFIVWYYKINNEVKLHDTNQQFSPGLATFALFIPIANFVTYYNTANRIKLMQKVHSSQDLISPVIAFLLLFLFYIGYPIYIQGALNNHWHEHAQTGSKMIGDTQAEDNTEL